MQRLIHRPDGAVLPRLLVSDGPTESGSLSIATNIAEGNGRFTRADRKNFFTIARGSVQECVPLLELARRRGFIEDAQVAGLRGQLEIIAKMLSGLISGLDKRRTW